MEFAKLIAERYSLRKFDAKPVEEEKLQAILQAGRLAPTAKNLQPQRIYVLKSGPALEKIRAVTPCAFNAPVVLMVCADTDEGWVNDFNGLSYVQTDTAIVTTHMMLRAQELGVGSCYVCAFDPAEAARAFGLPENIQPIALLPVGYPAEGAHPSRLHTARKQLEETVTVL